MCFKHLETTSRIPGQEGTMRWTVSIGKGLDATLLRRCFTKAVELCTALSRRQWRLHHYAQRWHVRGFVAWKKKDAGYWDAKQAFLECFLAFFGKKGRFYVKVRYSDILSNQGMHRRFSEKKTGFFGRHLNCSTRWFHQEHQKDPRWRPLHYEGLRHVTVFVAADASWEEQNPNEAVVGFLPLFQ